jgi:hypothetical protein
VVNGE